jgi:hypothetical protein
MWPEIQSELLPHQSVFDIPAVVCRAFHGRLEKLKVFPRQKFSGLAYEIESSNSKSGACHTLTSLSSSRQPLISVLDSFISAEFPDPNDDPELYNQVRRLHIHSQDHLTRPGSRCNRNNRCIYNYPQPMTPTTYMDDLGRVHYRRRKPEDAWMTPHVPALLRLLDCHIYVDVCATTLIFLYLYKYLFKGPDHARFTVHSLGQDPDAEQPRDKYRDYVDGPYLSSTEAYRFFGYNSVWKNPSVMCLPCTYLHVSVLFRRQQTPTLLTFTSFLTMTTTNNFTNIVTLFLRFATIPPARDTMAPSNYIRNLRSHPSRVKNCQTISRSSVSLHSFAFLHCYNRSLQAEGVCLRNRFFQRERVLGWHYSNCNDCIFLD